MKITQMDRLRWQHGMCQEHLYGDARRWVYTCLAEEYEQKGKLARLCPSTYGFRDAASICGDALVEWLKDRSLKVGIASLSFCCSQDEKLKG